MIIALSGKMGTGKSTLANYLISKSKNPVVVKIAGPIYEIQDLIYNHLDMKLQGEKDRPLLIAIGMWARDIDENFWTNIALAKAKKLEETHDLVIIDDCRFMNEAKVFDEHGLLIRILGQQRGPNLTPSAMNHPTETALDHYPFQYYIVNDGSIESSYEQLNNIIEQYKHTRR